MKLTTMEKDSIYDLMYINRKKYLFYNNKKLIENFFQLNKIELDIEFESFSEIFEYLTEHWDKKCKNEECENIRKLVALLPKRSDYHNVKRIHGIFKYCGKSCNYQSISKRQMGDKNTSHRMSKETLENMKLKNSILMKEKIKNGEFIPNVTNSWAKSRCDLKFYRDGILVEIKLRSTWDAYFQLYNKKFLYEKVVIPYKYKDVEKNYIVDFVDLENKILYEIKPNSTYNDPKNISKFESAKKWCVNNGYEYKIITDEWFKENYDESLVFGQPSEEKILRNLKQFK
jgi:hypothetical protein